LLRFRRLGPYQVKDLIKLGRTPDALATLVLLDDRRLSKKAEGSFEAARPEDQRQSSLTRVSAGRPFRSTPLPPTRTSWARPPGESTNTCLARTGRGPADSFRCPAAALLLPQGAVSARSPVLATPKQGGASRNERRGWPLSDEKRARRKRSEGLRPCCKREPFAVGVPPKAPLSTYCLPIPPQVAGQVADQGRQTAGGASQLRAEDSTKARLPVVFGQMQCPFPALPAKRRRASPTKSSKVGLSRAPTRVAGGGRFAAPILMARGVVRCVGQ
jgi:hypothetical protein